MNNLNDGVTSIGGQKRQLTEIYSRVVGYLRPKSQWNKGKQAEFVDRKVFTVN